MVLVTVRAKKELNKIVEEEREREEREERKRKEEEDGTSERCDEDREVDIQMGEYGSGLCANSL